MNTELLLKVKEQILQEPEKFQMADWHSTCGTMHCIGGWAERISGDTNPFRALGLTSAEGDRLFYRNDWPTQFEEPYRAAVFSLSNRARIAAERIDHFIATNGAE